jgi:hypothetical protein
MSENEKQLNIIECIKSLQREILIKKSLKYGFDFINHRPLNDEVYKSRLDEDVLKAVKNEI